MNAEILAVGTELLLGDIVNTNAQYLSKKLSEFGINVYYQGVVGDNPARLKTSVASSLERADMLVITGGLGPTQDDLTKETVCACLDVPLYMHEESLQRMKDFFASVNRPMTKNNDKQAMMPLGGTVLQNDCGTAPGCIISKGGKTVVLLPGPPVEMKMMFDRYVGPILLKQSDSVIFSRTLRLFGIGESRVEDLISQIIEKYTNPTVAPYAKLCEVHLRMTAKAATRIEAESMIDLLEREIRAILGEFIYGYDEDTLEIVAARLLLEKDMTLSIAESCTGGMISQMLTSVSGVSNVFGFGFVTYANEAKESLLGVRPATIKKFGAVSEQTAIEMSRGARRASSSDIALSITGIAGPGGDTKDKKVGLVYIAMSTPNGTICRRYQFAGSRERIRTQASMSALSMLINYLRN